MGVHDLAAAGGKAGDVARAISCRLPGEHGRGRISYPHAVQQPIAADMDYPMIVLSDACADMDSDVHRVLTEKILPTQATVVTAQEFVKAANTK